MTTTLREPEFNTLADLRYKPPRSPIIAAKCGPKNEGTSKAGAPCLPAHCGRGRPFSHAQISPGANDGSPSFSPSRDSAVGDWPREIRAANSFAMAAFTACRLRRRELRSEVTTKFANCPAKR